MRPTPPPGYDPDEAPDADAGIFGSPFSPEEASIVLVGVPWDATTSYRPGTAGAPASIRRASHQLDLWDVETGEPWREGIAMLDLPEDLIELNTSARADAERVIAVGGRVEGDDALEKARASVNEACAAMNAWVSASVAHWLEADKLVGVVGGDHSVAYAAIAEVARRHRGLGILQIDAHADLRTAYEGFDWSHASVFHNVVEHVGELGALVQVGIRDLSAGEAEKIEGDPRIRAWMGPAITRRKHGGEPFAQICREIVAALPEEVYVSFDIDGLDPSYCPHTGTPVPGGLSFDEACTLLRTLGESERKIVGFDLCEVGVSESEWDENVAARILYKLCGWASRSLS